MYKCPHCSARCHLLWQRLGVAPSRPITCAKCDQESRVPDKARVLETVGAEVLAIAAVITLLVLPWWAASSLFVAAFVGLKSLLAVAFPLVPTDPFGSTADTKRAALRFWLYAPLGLIVTAALLFTMLKR